jgi:SPP1 gp7 family putative phage head morphogenesis protein
MNNNKILNGRWKEVDKLITSFIPKNNKINKTMYDNLQSIFDGIDFNYNGLNSYASINQIKRLRTRIENIRDLYGISGYVGYQLNNLSKRTKIKNKDLLKGFIMVEYYRQYIEQNKLESELFKEIASITYEYSQKETIKALGKKRLFKKPRLLTVPEAFLLQLIGMSSFNGFNWYDYKEGNISYNTGKLYETIAINMQQEKPINVNSDEIMSLLKKQEKTYIAKKKEPRDKVYEDYKSDFYGSLDNQIAFLVNQIALKGMKDQGCKSVLFIAVMDDHTTDMCKSLDGQIFSIKDWNKYSRYSKEDDKNVIYTTKGLETGANLPPINNGFHYCRSTIYPYR